jgi:glycerol uptake facilitator-like aquaporin
MTDKMLAALSRQNIISPKIPTAHATARLPTSHPSPPSPTPSPNPNFGTPTAAAAFLVLVIVAAAVADPPLLMLGMLVVGVGMEAVSVSGGRVNPLPIWLVSVNV